jgi:16S rRNA G966 N2-methylase RsmD
MNINYYEKYIKYKSKYLQLLKNQSGGSFNYLSFFIGAESKNDLDSITKRFKDYFKNKVYLFDVKSIGESNIPDTISNSKEYPIIFYDVRNCDKSFEYQVLNKYYIKPSGKCNNNGYKIMKSKNIFNEIINIVNNDQIPKFPFKEGVDMKKIKLTDEGKYSYTKRKYGIRIMDFIKSKISNIKDLIILDGTANVGSDTILFSLNFKKVISIEINKENFDILKHNTGLYKQDNIELHLGDTTKDIYDYCFDILYLDPPWGGEDYKENEQIDLYLGEKRVDLFVKEVIDKYDKCKLKYIILKMPVNYNFDRLVKFGKNEKQKIGSFTLFFIDLS